MVVFLLLIQPTRLLAAFPCTDPLLSSGACAACDNYCSDGYANRALDVGGGTLYCNCAYSILPEYRTGCPGSIDKGLLVLDDSAVQNGGLIGVEDDPNAIPPQFGSYGYFGFVGVGKSATRSFIVRNAGEGILNVSGMTSSSPLFTLNNSVFSLDGSIPNISEPTVVECAPWPYASTSVEVVSVVFSPTGFGEQQTTISISSDALARQGDYTFTMRGIGAYVSLDPFGGSFPNTNVGSISPRNVTLTNIIATPVYIENITSSNSEFSVSGTGAIGQTLNPYESINFRVIFSPISEGLKNTEIRIFTDVSDDTVVSFSGTGIVAPVVLPVLPLSGLVLMSGFLIIIGLRKYRSQ